MSRIGKKPIQIPPGVQITVAEDKVEVKGAKGELRVFVPKELKVNSENGVLSVVPSQSDKVSSDEKKVKSLWGLTRTLISNAVDGVAKGHEKKLEIQGVGFKANVEGGDLVLMVGFSHPVRIKKIEGINFIVEKNIITVSGFDKELVGQITAKIRKVKEPEPYKGKGIRYLGEIVKIKVGKKAAGTETK
jgi:large subunit ribosomal protein L6